jgi:hypothetical protein
MKYCFQHQGFKEFKVVFKIQAMIIYFCLIRLVFNSQPVCRGIFEVGCQILKYPRNHAKQEILA